MHLQAIPSVAGNGRQYTFGAEWVMLEVDGGFEPLGSSNFDASSLDWAACPRCITSPCFSIVYQTLWLRRVARKCRDKKAKKEARWLPGRGDNAAKSVMLLLVSKCPTSNIHIGLRLNILDYG